MSASTRPGTGILGTLLLAALLATTLIPHAVHAAPPAAPAAAAQDDDATLRRDARRDWYGGDRTPAYRRFLFDAAQAEHARRERLRTKSLSMSGASGTSPTWRNLGPTRSDYEVNGVQIGGIDSGRISGLVVSPADSNTIYVATSGGGVWKTANGGQSWLPLTDSLPDLFIGAIEMDPANPNLIYIGLGDFADSAGTGVGAFLKSADGGQTWSSPVSLSQQNGATLYTATYIKQLLASPSVPGLILAATDAGLFRSVDYGSHWAAVTLPGAAGSAPAVWSIAWTGGTGFVAALINAASYYGPGLVYFSQDSGASWTPSSGISLVPNGAGRITLAAAPTNPSTVYALVGDSVTLGLGDIFGSSDGGATWTPLNISSPPVNPNPDIADIVSLFGNQEWYDQLLLVSPTDPNTLFFGGSYGIAYSNDRGATYSQITNWVGQDGLPYVHADLQYGRFDSSGNLYIGTDGGLFVSRDGGLTWISGLNAGIVSHLCYSVSSSLANRDAVIGGLQDDGTRLRAGASSTFNMVIGGDGIGSHLHALNANLMLGSTYNQQIDRSSDGGVSWQPATSGIVNGDVFYTRIVAGGADPTGNTVYTLTSQTVYQSTDYALSWTALGTTGLPTTALRNLAAAASDPKVLGVIAASNHAALSSDGGTSWREVGPLPNTTGYLSAITFDPANAQVLYVTSVAPDAAVTHVWKSVNSGGNWTALDGTGSGLPAGIPMNGVFVDPTNSQHLYAGTLFGLYQSADGGSTWAVAGTGLPMVDVTDVYVAPDASLLRIATYGRGFWELTATTPAGGVTVSPGTLMGGLAGAPLATQTLSASGGKAPYAFALTAGALPDGLTLSPSGALDGTPTTTGVFTFRLTATDSTSAASGGPLTGSQVYAVTITSPPALVLAPTALPDGVSNQPYPAQAFSVTGGTAPYSFAVTIGNLPAGLALSSPGSLGGTPTAPGTSSFRVTATDSTPSSGGGPLTADQIYTMTVALPAYAADSYDGTRLTIPSLSIGNAIYSNVVVTVGGIVSGPTGTAPVGARDSYDPSSHHLTIPEVRYGSRTYYNVVITVAGLISIGSVTGADVYDGQYLHVSYVEYLSKVYPAIVLSVGLANIVSVAGGMPAATLDQYDSATGHVLIPAVQYGQTVYTNVTIRAGPANIVH